VNDFYRHEQTDRDHIREQENPSAEYLEKEKHIRLVFWHHEVAGRVLGPQHVVAGRCETYNKHQHEN
jgi:hypothetical protein